MKAWLRIFTVILSTLLLLLLAAWGASYHPKVQTVVLSQINQLAAREFNARVKFQSFRLRPGIAGLVVTLKEVDLCFRCDKPSLQGSAPLLEELTVQLNPFRIDQGFSAISSVSIKNPRLSLLTSPHELRLDPLGWQIKPSEASELWAKITSKPRQDRSWPRFAVENLRLSLVSAAAEPTLGEIKLSFELANDLALESLAVSSFSLDVRTLMQNIFGFAEQMPALASSLPAANTMALIKKAQVNDLSLTCEENLLCSGEIKQIQFSSMGAGWIPGTESLLLRLKLSKNKASLSWNDSQWKIGWPNLSEQPIHIQSPPALLHITFQDSGVLAELPITPLTYNGLRTRITARVVVPIDAPENTELDFQAEADDTEWKTVLAVLPDKVLGKKLMNWLQSNVQQSQIHAIKAVGKGRLKNYASQNIGDGHLLLNAQISNARLTYLPGYPALKDCQGAFEMKNLSIDISQLSCQSRGVRLIDGRVQFPDLAAEIPWLDLGLKARSDYAQGIDFLNATPLGFIPKVLQTLGVRGQKQSTALTIKAALSQSPKAPPLQLQGRTLVQRVKVETPLNLMKVSASQLVATFDEKGLRGLNGNLKSDEETLNLSVKRRLKANQLAIKIVSKEGLPQAEALAFPADTPTRIWGKAQNLELASGAAHADVEAFELLIGDQPSLSLRGSSQIQDFGRLAALFGLPSLFDGGQGSGQFDLKLNHLGLVPIAESLSGTLSLDLKKGQITSLPPWAATTLNTSNFKVFNLPSDHLYYHRLDAKMTFAEGSLHFDESHMDLGLLEVQALGSVDFKADRLNLNLTFIPDLGSAPPAIALGLWNPWLGAALYGASKLEDRASDSWFNRMVSQTYKLEGQSSNPSLHLIRPLNIMDAFR